MSITAEIVREARQGRGLSQAQLGAMAGAHESAIWKLESDGSGKLDLLERVLAVLDVKLAGLPRGHDLAERIAKARARSRLSLIALAERAGVSKGAVIRLERGEARIATFEAVAAVVGPVSRVHKRETAGWQAGGRDVRYTPPEMIAGVRRVLGGIDLDPCSGAMSHVGAKTEIAPPLDGLSLPWNAATVWVNPPFSEAQDWLRKSLDEVDAGRAGAVLAITPSRPWGPFFTDVLVKRAVVYFLRDRVRFCGVDGKPLGFTTAYGLTLYGFGGDAEMWSRLEVEFPGVRLA